MVSRRRPPNRLMTALAAALCLLLLGGILAAPVLADSNTTVLRALSAGDAYVTNTPPSSAHIAPGDQQRLQRQADLAHSRGADEKFALLSHYPSTYHSPAAAASALRHFLDFSGVLVLVSPAGIALSSDQLSTSEDTAIADAARPQCLTQSWTACALFAGQRALTQVRADKNAAFRGATIFWLVLLAVIAALFVIAGLVIRGRRKRLASNTDDLRRAATNTLALADTAVQEIEASGTKMSAEVRTEYDRALGLRSRARTEIDRAATDQALGQANEDAAQAVLALQGVLRKLGIQTALTNPIDLPEHRCFYCGRTDRPPYVTRTIDDGRGNSMEVEICAVDQQRLQQGQTPQIATVAHGGTPMPWWAVPGNPWYYAYGGPSWQYWLPFMVGMDVGGWFGGGYGYGFGGYGYGDFDGGQGYIDPGGQYDPGFGQQAPTDAGGAGFGGWGDPGNAGDAGGADFGGWGDGGGSDFGGDSGGSDWSGGDGGGWG